MDKTQRLLQELRVITEHPELEPQTILADTQLWDSMAWVQVIAVMDDLGVQVNGDQMAACVTAGDVLKLAGA